jgi:hypothetical protein
MRYLIFCLILAFIFLIAATVMMLVYDNQVYIYLYCYGGLEILVALIVFCRLQMTPRPGPNDVIIVNQNIPLQGNGMGSPYEMNNNRAINQNLMTN